MYDVHGVPSRQFDHLHALSLARLKARVPSDCPLVVRRMDDGGFVACTIDGRDAIHGRFQVVHAFIDGYVAAWRVQSDRADPELPQVGDTDQP